MKTYQAPSVRAEFPQTQSDLYNFLIVENVFLWYLLPYTLIENEEMDVSNISQYLYWVIHLSFLVHQLRAAYKPMYVSLKETGGCRQKFSRVQ